jgi:hypothetical protein
MASSIRFLQDLKRIGTPAGDFTIPTQAINAAIARVREGMNMSDAELTLNRAVAVLGQYSEFDSYLAGVCSISAFVVRTPMGDALRAYQELKRVTDELRTRIHRV